MDLVRTLWEKCKQRLWIAILLGVPFVAVLGVQSILGTPLGTPLDSSLANSFLGVVAQVLAGMLAIVFSVSIVAVQITSGRYTPRLFSYFIRDRGTAVALPSLLGCIFLSVVAIGVQSMPMFQWGFLVMVFYFVLCLLALLYYFHRTVQLLDPMNLAKRIRDDTLRAINRQESTTVLDSISSLGDVAIKAFERGEEEVATTYLDRLHEVQVQLVRAELILIRDEGDGGDVAHALRSTLFGYPSPVIDQYSRLFRAASAKKSEAFTLHIAYLLEQEIVSLITDGGSDGVLWGMLLQYLRFLRIAVDSGDASADRLVRSLANIVLAPTRARTLSEEHIRICLQALEMANKTLIDGKDIDGRHFELWKAQLNQFSTILPGGQARGPFHTELETLVYELKAAGILVSHELSAVGHTLAWAIGERMTPARRRISDLMLSHIESLIPASQHRLHERVRIVKGELQTVYVATCIYDTFFRVCVRALRRQKHDYIKELWRHVNPPDASAHWANVNLINLNVGFLTHQLSINLRLPWQIDGYHGSDAYVCRYYLLCLALALRRRRSDWHLTILPFTEESLAKGDAYSEALAQELSRMHTFLINLPHHADKVLTQYDAVSSMAEEWDDVFDGAPSEALEEARGWLANEDRRKEWIAKAEGIIRDLPIDNGRVEAYKQAALKYHSSESNVGHLAVTAREGDRPGTELKGTCRAPSLEKRPFTVIGLGRPQQLGGMVGFGAVGQIVQAEVAHIARTIMECEDIKPISARQLTFHAVARAAKEIDQAGGSATVLLAPDDQIASAWHDDPDFTRHLDLADAAARYLKVDESTKLMVLELNGHHAFVLDTNAGEWTVLTPLNIEVLEREENPLAVQITAHETVDYQVRDAAAAKVLEFTSWGYARGCLIAYLKGKKGLNWVVGAIQSSEVRGSRLAQIFEELQDCGDSDRYLRARTSCADQGWL